MSQEVQAADHPPAVIELLLIEDDAAQAQRVAVLLAALQATRFEVTLATDADEAIQKLRAGSFDAMLLDLEVSEGQGRAAMAAVKEAAPSTPIVLLTADEDESAAFDAVRLGAQDWVSRGNTDPLLLVRTISHAVERSRILRQLHAAQEREHFLATHDSLTELPSRFHFQELLRDALTRVTRERKPLALLALDLDRFKSINDTLGHEIGDELLKMVVERLRQATRKADILARLGGDEFVVMLHAVARELDPAKVAQHLIDALSKSFTLGGQECWITASIGIALFPRDGTDAGALIRNAEAAVCESKAQGRNRYHFYAEHMNDVANRQFGIEKRLHEAIERKEFVLHFQPQVDVSTGQIVGTEALVRWQHPQRGLVPPNDFIPIAEETGLIAPIGDWVMRTACEYAVRWNEQRRHPIRMGVNVSTRQLNQKFFASAVGGILRDTGLEARWLDIEITESSVLEPGGLTAASLLGIRRLGVRLSIDDFGTGYSSLTALMGLRVNGFKIDRSFISNLITNPTNATITGTLIVMAKGLGLELIAEGVETVEQMQHLYSQGCAHMQGYLLGKPVSAEEFEAQLDSPAAPWREATEGLVELE